MNFDETIRLQALRLKQLNTQGSSMPDALIDSVATEAVKEGKLKNICAAVSVELFGQVNDFCNSFDISKRRFVELALVDALRSASKIVEEVQPFDQEHA